MESWGASVNNGPRACRRLAVPALLLLAVATQAAAQADRIFLNAKVWTGDDAKPAAEAFAVTGDRLSAVGSNAEVRALAGSGTAVLDLHGRRVIPGFQDSHLHFPGPLVNEIDLSGADNLVDFQARIAAFVKNHPGTAWVLGRGWGYSAFPDQKPDKKYLDALIPDRPVYLTERDGHMGLANSKALAVAGIAKSTPDPPNGRIVRGADDQPTGELQESAQRLLDRHIPGPSIEELYQAFRQHMDEAAAAGITSVQNASWDPELQTLVLRVLAEGSLKIRFRLAPPILPGAGLSPRNHTLKTPLTSADLSRYKELRDTFRGPLVEFGAVKGMLDGTVDAKTAAMLEPYAGGGTGIPFWEQEDLNRTVALYDQEGFQVMLHAIGDRAIRMALDSFEYAAKTNGTSGRRHRIEHIEVPALSDLPRFRQLGVIASTQAIFADPDPTTLDNYAPLLGPERASHSNSFKQFDDAGAVQAFGSDWPVFPMAPLPAIYCAVTRMTRDGKPAGGWYPQGRISVEAALRHYTRDGAYASFAENLRGSLTAGKLADFVVLSDDILAIPAAQILNTRVLLTVMGGRTTYRAAEFQ